METGMVKVLKVAAAHDVGVAINPVLVEGQIGAVLQGVGYAIPRMTTRKARLLQRQLPQVHVAYDG